MASSGSRSAAVRLAWQSRKRAAPTGLGRVFTAGSVIKGSVKRGALARTLRIDRALLIGKSSRPTGRLGAIQAANKHLLSRVRLADTVRASRNVGKLPKASSRTVSSPFGNVKVVRRERASVRRRSSNPFGGD